MAKMKKLDLKSLEEGVKVKVGNNREIKKSVGGEAFIGYLHGHPIFFHNDTGVICLDTRGYNTATTRQAMNDFLDYFGYPYKVSLAKGKLTVWINGVVYAEGSSAVVFTD